MDTSAILVVGLKQEDQEFEVSLWVTVRAPRLKNRKELGSVVCARAPKY